MQTLDDIKNGSLKGSKVFKFSGELTQFPDELFDLADSLEMLDLSGNKLFHLPNRFKEFKKLKIAFFSDNCFTEFPEILYHCPQLEMIGFKSNQINFISENAIPKHTRWLILTNNKIESLPKSIGECYRLQKCGLAGNRLTHLPDEMANCKNLELLRISANAITVFPSWLLALPKLSWLAFAGNPFSNFNKHQTELLEIDWDKLVVKELLGQGASGMIYKAEYATTDIAVKLFKGEVTSDGLPDNEMQACIEAGEHSSLVKVIGKLKQHPEGKDGLAMGLLSKDYVNLGMPPDFDTCTRDTYPNDIKFTVHQIISVAKNICAVSEHLHQKGILHGDLYAHNILINSTHHAILGDFGAATIYNINTSNAQLFEKLDVRAYGCLLDDLLERVEDKAKPSFSALHQIKENCLSNDIKQRLNFSEILNILQSL